MSHTCCFLGRYTQSIALKGPSASPRSLAFITYQHSRIEFNLNPANEVLRPLVDTAALMAPRKNNVPQQTRNFPFTFSEFQSVGEFFLESNLPERDIVSKFFHVAVELPLDPVSMEWLNRAEKARSSPFRQSELVFLYQAGDKRLSAPTSL
ncbi:hypothetical protein BDQ17DRAFT_1421459 [Cyathus striatus]|nr:hypothetical protein BDQ17DRAFT_1421459 [Cyathus striatus]